MRFVAFFSFQIKSIFLHRNFCHCTAFFDLSHWKSLLLQFVQKLKVFSLSQSTTNNCILTFYRWFLSLLTNIAFFLFNYHHHYHHPNHHHVCYFLMTFSLLLGASKSIYSLSLTCSPKREQLYFSFIFNSIEKKWKICKTILDANQIIRFFLFLWSRNTQIV